MGDELASRTSISAAGRIDDFGTYRFVCPVPECQWFQDENTTHENPGWRDLVEAAISAHITAEHPSET